MKNKLTLFKIKILISIPTKIFHLKQVNILHFQTTNHLMSQTMKMKNQYIYITNQSKYNYYIFLKEYTKKFIKNIVTYNFGINLRMIIIYNFH